MNHRKFFYQLSALEGDATTITGVILKLLKDIDIPVHKLYWAAFDAAANMSG